MRYFKIIVVGVVCLLTLAVASCTFYRAPSFTPTTMAGAVCKKECANRQGVCGNYGSCVDAYARCIEACMDIDRIGQK